MRRIRSAVLIVTLLGAGLVSLSSRARDPYSLAQTLPTDPTIAQGKLACGMRYVIKPIPAVAGISLQLVLPAGTLRESDSQRGASDLLHRMAIAQFQQAQSNHQFDDSAVFSARFSYDSTSFAIELPQSDTRQVQQALVFFRELLEHAPNDPDAMKSSKLASLNRSRSLDIARVRAQERLLGMLELHTPYAQRHPLMAHNPIEALTQKEVDSYHARWYAPDNAILVLTGNLVSEIAQQQTIESIFADLPLRRVRGVTRQKVPDPPPLRTIRLIEPGLELAVVEYILPAPPIPPIRSYASLRESILLKLGVLVMSQRLDQALSAYPELAMEAKVNNHVLSEDYLLHNVLVSGPFETVQSMVQALGSSLSSTDVTQDELLQSEQSLRAQSRSGMHSKKARSTRRQAVELATLALRNDVMMHPDDARASMNTVLASISTQDLAEHMNPRFNRSRGWLVLSGNESLEAVSLDHVMELFKQAAPPEPAQLATLCQDDAELLCLELPGPAAKVVSIAMDPADSVFNATLSNNTTVHHHYDPSTPGMVSLSVAIRRPEQDSRNSLTQAAITAFRAPSSDTHSRQQIEAWLQERNITMQGEVHADAITLTITAPTEYIESAARLTAALLEKPRIEPSAFASWQLDETRTRARQRYSAYDAIEPLLEWIGLKLPGPVLQDTPDVDIPFQREDVQSWLGFLIRQQPLQVAVTGDITSQIAVATVSKTIGKLSFPAQQREPAHRATKHPNIEPIDDIIVLPEAGTQGVSLLGYRIPAVEYENRLPELMVLEQRVSLALHKKFATDPRASFPPIVYMDRSSTSDQIAFFLCLVPSTNDSIYDLHNEFRDSIHQILKQPPDAEQLRAAKVRAKRIAESRLNDSAYQARNLVLQHLRGLAHSNSSDLLERIDAVTGDSLLTLARDVASPKTRIDIILVSRQTYTQQP